MPRPTGWPVLAVLATLATAAHAGDDGQDFSRIEHGRYLAVVGDCAGCHTAEAGRDFAGGRPIETPFGIVVAANITPDQETGIGVWTDDQFVSALTQGIGDGGEHLYPAMPYPYYTKATRDDVLAIRAYLATVPAVKNAVHSDRLPFPFSVRAGMAVWNELYFKSGVFSPRADKSAEWNRGAYLAEGLMHCGACHTPKNFAGADQTGERLQGGVLQGWFAPDITGAARRGLGGWSADDIVAYLETGHNRTAAASGPMAEEVERSSSKMTKEDLRAVAVYLKDHPGQGEESHTPLAASDPTVKRGAAIYADECSACHAPRGTGEPGLFPALAGAPAVQSADATSLIRVVLSGTRSVATEAAPTAPAMPAFGWALDDGEVGAVLTYIRNSWGNAASAITAGRVADERATLSKH